MISSLSNERIKAARKLHTRQHRRRTGSFLIEGVRLIRDAVQSGHYPECVFYSPDSAAHTDSEQLLASLQEQGIELALVSPKVLASLSQTVTPQGVVAVARIPDMPLPAPSSLTLVLDGVADPGNAGTLLRSAEAAGADLVIFGPDSVDSFNDKVVRAGMGAHFRLPLRICATWPQVQATIADAAGAEGGTYVAEASAPLSYHAVDWRQPVVVIIGSEATGPSDAAHVIATPVSIPMQGPVESLNAAMAGVIILFEAARQRTNYVQA